MEVLTLVQTGKIRRIPVILVQSAYWGKLVDWFRDTLVAQGMVDAADMDLIRVIDQPDDVVEAIFQHYEARGFEPTGREREILFNL